MTHTKRCLDKLEELFWPIQKHYDLNKLYEEQRSTHNRYLVEKYGQEVVDEHQRISELLEAAPTPENLQRAYDFDYRTGIYLDTAPRTNYRNRLTLRSLVNCLSSSDSGINIVDFGIGDGRTMIGLVLLLDNIANIYGIDFSREGLLKFEETKSMLRENERDKINKIIVEVYGDYTSSEFNRQFLVDKSKKFDFVLGIYPPDLWQVLIHGRQYLNQSGKIVGYLPQPVPNDESGVSCLYNDLGPDTFSLGYNMKVIDSIYFKEYESIFGMVFTPIKNTMEFK